MSNPISCSTALTLIVQEKKDQKLFLDKWEAKIVEFPNFRREIMQVLTSAYQEDWPKALRESRALEKKLQPQKSLHNFLIFFYKLVTGKTA